MKLEKYSFRKINKDPIVKDQSENKTNKKGLHAMAWLAQCVWASKKRPKDAGSSMVKFIFFYGHPPCVFLEKQIASDASLIATNNALLALPMSHVYGVEIIHSHVCIYSSGKYGRQEILVFYQE
jgi:hypothetical protein